MVHNFLMWVGTEEVKDFKSSVKLSLRGGQLHIRNSTWTSGNRTPAINGSRGDADDRDARLDQLLPPEPRAPLALTLSVYHPREAALPRGSAACS